MNEVATPNNNVLIRNIVFWLAVIAYIVRAVFSAPSFGVGLTPSTSASAYNAPFASWQMSGTVLLLIVAATLVLSSWQVGKDVLPAIVTFLFVANIAAVFQAFDRPGASLQTQGWVGAIFQTIFFALLAVLVILEIKDKTLKAPVFASVGSWLALVSFITVQLAILTIAFSAGSYKFTFGGVKADEMFLRVQPLETVGLILAVISTALLAFFGAKSLYSALAGLVIVVLSYCWIFVTIISVSEQTPIDVWMVFGTIFAIVALAALVVSIREHLNSSS